jgi:hypothetical protein
MHQTESDEFVAHVVNPAVSEALLYQKLNLVQSTTQFRRLGQETAQKRLDKNRDKKSFKG